MNEEEMIEEDDSQQIVIPPKDLTEVYNKIMEPASEHKELHKDYGMSYIKKDQMPQLWYALLFMKQLDMVDSDGRSFNLEKAKKFFSFVPDMIVETMPAQDGFRSKMFVTTIQRQRIEQIERKKKKRGLW